MIKIDLILFFRRRFHQFDSQIDIGASAPIKFLTLFDESNRTEYAIHTS